MDQDVCDITFFAEMNQNRVVMDIPGVHKWNVTHLTVYYMEVIYVPFCKISPATLANPKLLYSTENYSNSK